MSRRKKKTIHKQQILIYAALLALCVVIGIFFTPEDTEPEQFTYPQQLVHETVSLDNIPEYAGEPYVVLNDNQPEFNQDDMTTEGFETFASLDYLGRCGVCYANVCPELMPTESRGDISSVKPTGWHSVSYEFVDGNSLYNRCHLIGFQLTGENANERNLITGTRYMNVDGMLPFENLIADYVKETGNHVLYRVTPYFVGDELVARGVQMEAWSVEDNGEGVCFHVYCYNVQPGVEIDYATGESWEAEKEYTGESREYVLNTSSKKFHDPSCSGVANISEANRSDFTGTREELIDLGYTPCGTCDP